jgi:hypothetical protein
VDALPRIFAVAVAAEQRCPRPSLQPQTSGAVASRHQLSGFQFNGPASTACGTFPSVGRRLIRFGGLTMTLVWIGIGILALSAVAFWLTAPKHL